jgi:transcriptional regulator with XRE-family HTH domain
MNKIIKYNGKLNVIGNNVKKYREAEKMSLNQLSNKLLLLGVDIPKSSIQNIEKGKRIVKEYEFYALCKVFNISMEDMLKDFIKELE